jgi:Fic family protein
MFSPNYRVIPEIARALAEIDAVRVSFSVDSVHPGLLQSLWETAALESTHFSTQIEGNVLTLPQVKAVLEGTRFPERARDELEVRNHYRAFEFMELLAERAGPLREEDVQTLHGLVMDGRLRATPYRRQQNVVKDSGSGRIVYLPPEAHDVPRLMAELVEWTNRRLEDGTPAAPVTAALAHYQFATVHPYLDGNGRTARLLATLILRRAGYGLQGIYSLDEYYAERLGAYYAALTVGSHNYYQGRAEADVTPFVAYFCVAHAAQRKGLPQGADQSILLRELDQRQRRLLPLFQSKGGATAREMAAHLNLSERTLVGLCRDWVLGGFLEYESASRKIRSYRLAGHFADLVR